MKEVKEIWRGWQGHFICLCRFHLNTLVVYGKKKIVVSTVGEYYPGHLKGKMDTIGCDRFYETMVFYSSNDKYNDADVTQELYEYFCGYNEELEAQKGHYEILRRVKKFIIKQWKMVTLNYIEVGRG